jgi:hypothetical protein
MIFLIKKGVFNRERKKEKLVATNITPKKVTTQKRKVFYYGCNK